MEVFHSSHIRLIGTHKDITFLLHLTVLQSSTKLMIGDACVAVLRQGTDDLQKFYEIKHDRAAVVGGIT